MKIRFDVTGMGCSACQAAVEKAVSSLPGITSVNVSLVENSMVVVFEESLTDAKTIVNAVKKAGYGAKEEEGAKPKPKLKDKEICRRFVISVALLLPLVYLNLAGMYSLPHPMNLSPYLQMVLSLVIILINRKYFVRGWKSIVNKAPGMDALISIGSFVSFVYSVYLVISNILTSGTFAYTSYFNMRNASSMGNASNCIYFFESSGMILTLITLGKMLESNSREHTMDAIGNLLKLAPMTASVERAGIEESIKVAEIIAGDTVLVRMGERVSADGTIVFGNGTFDNSSLTGESLTMEKGEGDFLAAGSLCLDGFVKINVEKAGKDTTLSKVIELVREAGAGKAPIQRLADKVSGYFVPVVLGISIVTFICWLISGAEFAFALNMAISVTVISCPCALGLATPVAIMAGTGNAASSGIIIKSAECLETAKNIDAVIFDKTGTVTEGNMTVTDVCVSKAEDEKKFIFMAAVLETVSTHPYAKAVKMHALDSFSAMQLMEYKAEDAQIVQGGGIIAKIGQDIWCAGNEKLMAGQEVLVSELTEEAEILKKQGKSVLFFARNKALVGIIAVADRIKPESVFAIQKMKEAGMKIILATGDNRKTAETIAGELGIEEVLSEVLPEEKHKKVLELQKAGYIVAMVGDGVNDAPALASADIGIAIGNGTEVAADAADFILMRNSVGAVEHIVSLSKRVMKVIKQNLFWAFLYNFMGIPIAAGVLYPSFGIKLTPGIAVACMSLSSLFVVLNALRLRKK